MSTEVGCAVDWLAAALLPKHSTHRTAFEDSVRAELEAHYTGHWYPNEAHRGCAYRSLTCNSDIDPLLARALAKASIPRDQLLSKNHFILWVNPGEVKVNDRGAKSHIFCAGSAPNPYSRPKVNVEPTRLNVRANEDELSGSSAGSSAATTPTGSPLQLPRAAKLSPSAVKFIPHSSQSSDESSEGEPEVPPMPPLPEPVAYAPPLPPTYPPGVFMASWPQQQGYFPVAAGGFQQQQPGFDFGDHRYAVRAH